ncbi:MAG: GatB/YqeY domain-containing protein [Candidatus Berkelbacteria bacterium]|nr:GatB/YqeY domain-containing protein [Candidatus Berkelbacteria bacterium]
MNNIISQIDSDFKDALKNHDELRTSTLRLLKSSIHNLEIEKQHELSQEEIWQLINKEIKQRRDSIDQYKAGKREDLAQKEETEIKIISTYAPAQLSDEELRKIVKDAVVKTNAKDASDMGKVMKEAMLQIKGRADGSKVSQVAIEELKRG